MTNFDYRKFLKENKSTFHSTLTEGQFSWMTQDTGQQIGSQEGNTIPVYMFDNTGKYWFEKEYEGYGVFGGKDYYELLDQMNGGTGDRSEGIRKAFDPTAKGETLFPALVVGASNFDYKTHDFTQEAEHDPNQSWLSPEEEDDYMFSDEEEEYGYDDEKELDENITEAVMDVATVAQAVADAFTADDPLDIKYVITPGSVEGDLNGGGFDLDAVAGPNTPGEDWEDENGFGIDYYLGKYAGGSFVIKNEGDVSVVKNAAMRNAVIAYVTPEGEIDMVYNQENHYNTMSDKLTGMKKAEEAKKPNKMKKSELKEMIKAAMMAETTGAAIEAEEYDPVAEAEEKIEEGTWSVLPARIPEFIQAVEDLKDEYHGVVGDDEVFNGLDAAISAAEELLMNTAEIKEAEEEVDAEEVDSEIDTPEGDAEIETTDVETTAEVDPNVKAVQDSLTQAMEAAKALGDNKLEAQIGNTITFFTRSHVAQTELDENNKEYYKDAEADDAEHIKALEKDMADDKEDSMKIGEVLFPMWTRINK